MFKGETPPAPPTVRSTAGSLEVVSDERRQQTRSTRHAIRMNVAPGATVRLSVDGRRINLAAGLLFEWLDEQGAPLDHSRTSSLMNRFALTSPRPEHAEALHLEYADPVAGVWVERGGADPVLRTVQGAARPHQVDLRSVTRPFHFTVDFASEGPHGPRVGARWWLSGGERVGPILESA